MMAGIFSLSPLPGTLVALAALTLTPVLGCAGSQHPDNTGSTSTTPEGGATAETSATGQTGATGDTSGGMGSTGAGQTGQTGQTGQMGASGGETRAEPKQVIVPIDPKSGSKMTGTATFTSEGGKVTVKIDISGAPAGVHAVHIHEKGDCSSADGESAGGHWNPTSEAHGKWGNKPYHLGDIGNIDVGKDGTGSISVTSDQWTLGTGGTSDVIGHAIVVHGKADDFKSQPSGAAGTRIGCGVIQRK